MRTFCAKLTVIGLERRNRGEQRATTSSDSSRLRSRLRSNPHLWVRIIAVYTSCDSRTAIVFVSEGSERVKTATLSFKRNYSLPLSPLARAGRVHLERAGLTMSFAKQAGKGAARY